MKGHRWTSEEDRLLIQLYTIDRKTSNEITRLLNLKSLYATRWRIQKLNLKANKSPGNRTHKLNEEYFDILNRNSSYWFGFIAADGCLIEGRNTISIGLSIKDKDHLIRFQNNIESDYPILETIQNGFKANTELCYLRINSKHLYNRLLELGLTPRKSNTLRYPESVPKDMQAHFLRGYSDGDGCWNNTGSRLRWTLSGTKHFLERTLEILKENGITTKATVRPTKRSQTLHSLELHCKPAVQLAIFLYQDAPTYLPRKRNIIISRFTGLQTSFLSNS